MKLIVSVDLDLLSLNFQSKLSNHYIRSRLKIRDISDGDVKVVNFNLFERETSKVHNYDK